MSLLPCVILSCKLAYLLCHIPGAQNGVSLLRRSHLNIYKKCKRYGSKPDALEDIRDLFSMEMKQNYEQCDIKFQSYMKLCEVKKQAIPVKKLKHQRMKSYLPN